MTIAVVTEKTSGARQDGVTSVVTATWTVAAGSVLLAFVLYEDDGNTITVADTVNGTYGAAIETILATGVNGLKCFAFTNSAAGSNAVTATFSANQNTAAIWVIELSGAKTAGAIDTHNHADQSAPGTGANAITVSATNTAQPAMVVGLSTAITGSGDIAPNSGTGYTAGIKAFGVSGTDAEGRSEWKRVTNTASQAATFTVTAGNDLLRYLSIVVNVLEATSSLVKFAPEPILRAPEGARRMPFQTEALPPLVKRGAGFEALIVRTQPARPLKSNQPDAVPPIFKKIAAFDPVIIATRPAPRRVPTEERGVPKPPPMPSMRLDDVEIEQTWPVPKRPPIFTEALPPILSHLGGVDPLIVRTLAPAVRVPNETHVPPPIVLDIGAFDPVIVPTRPARRLVSSQPEAPPAIAASADPILGLAGLHFYVSTKVIAPTHSGADVTAWTDISSLHNDLNVVTANKPQLLANGGVQFLAANATGLSHQGANSIGTGAYCIGILVKVDAVIDNEVLFGDVDAATGGVNVKITTTSLADCHENVVFAGIDGTLDTTSYHVVIWDRAAGAAPVLYLDGAAVTLGSSSTSDPIASGTGATSGIALGQFGNADIAHASETVLAAFIVGGSSIGSSKATDVYNYWFAQYLATGVAVDPSSAPIARPTILRSNFLDALPPIFRFLGGIDPTIAATLPPAKRTPSQADATPPIFQAIAAFDPVIVATWPAPRRVPVEASGTPPIDSPRGGFDHLIVATLLPARRTPQSAETAPPIVLDIAGFDPLIVKTLPAARTVPVHFEATPPIDVQSGGFDSVIVATLPAARRTPIVLDATPPIVQHIAGFDPLIVPTRPAPLRAPVLAEGVPPILISVGGFDPSLAPNPYTVRRTLITDALSGVPTPWLSDLAQPVPRPAIYRAPSSPDGVPPVLTHLGGVDPVIVQTLPAPKRVPVQADATPPILISVGGFDLFVRLARPATIPSSSAESPPGARAVAGIDGASSPRPAGARTPAQTAEATPPIVLHIAAFDPVIAATLPAPRRLSNQADAVPPIVRSVGGWDTYRAPLLSPARRSDTSETFAQMPTPWLSDVASPTPRVAVYRRPNQVDATPPILIFLGGVDPVAVSTLRPARRAPQEADSLPAIFRQLGGFDPVRAAPVQNRFRTAASTDVFAGTVVVLTAWADAVSPRQAPALVRRPDLTDPLPSPIATAITPWGYEPSTWLPSRGRSQPSQATDALPPFVVTLVLDDATRTRLPLVERSSAATEAFPGALHAWAPDSPGDLPRAGDRRRSAANDALPATTLPWAPDAALATPRPAWTSPRAREALVAQPMPMLVLGHWAPDPNVAGQPAGQRARVSFATDAFPFLTVPLAPVGGLEQPTFPWRSATPLRPTTLDVFSIRAVLKAFLQLDDIAAADLELLDAAVAELLASDVAVPNDGPLDLPVATVEVTDRSVAEDEALDE